MNLPNLHLKPTNLLNPKTLANTLASDFIKHLLYLYTMMMHILKGLARNPEVVSINRLSVHLGQAMKPGAYLVDLCPILCFVPSYLSQLNAWHKEECCMRDDLWFLLMALAIAPPLPVHACIHLVYSQAARDVTGTGTLNSTPINPLATTPTNPLATHDGKRKQKGWQLSTSPTSIG
ncbi:hypothetical protein BDR06DRAFT_968817 [Suillus hirtellus]|nr:hypothetical protein BDR06DRAFT_968817 [Suillus hirtellus]